MSFDIVNGVAHIKLWGSWDSSDTGGIALRENLLNALNEYITTWERQEKEYFNPSWTSSAQIEIHNCSGSQSGTSYGQGVYIALWSYFKNKSNSTYFKADKNYWYYREVCTCATPESWNTYGNIWEYLYLNIVKSKTGRSFAFSLSHNPTNQMECLCAEDETGNIAMFQLGGISRAISSVGYRNFSSYLFLARDEKQLSYINPTSSAENYARSQMQGSFLCLDPIIKPNIKTSLVRTPNLLGTSQFKELYSILSTSIPISELDDAVFVIDGHKYKVISCYSNPKSMYNQHSYSTTRCAGPFALEIE